ncbi:hypothetical protein SAMN02745174_01515 [Cetobacterium ceti]|uniref:Probable membrane transporter protein n=1 Tax=Cetobacterium ceti TaxID=180163 RepID=A0A1T4NE98_9FUSO|nr:sulfite exporter TauE/SafE family protein [Cetobacterium ceti]SJZ77435.1 hypothetical protein SAMN02745174_01515 [Cetobacterium ceti]
MEELLILIITGLGIGMSLMGVSTSIIFSPLIVWAYGSKLGNGIMIIPYFIADIYITYKYRKDFNVKDTLKLVPFAFLGMILAIFLIPYISEEIFSKILGILIIITNLLFFIKNYEKKFKKFASFFGFFGGLSSYLANISGPIFNIYFLSLNKNQKNFIGNRALFFTFLNFIKLFLYFFIYKNISTYTLSRSLITIPFLFLGIFSTGFFLKKISSETFSKIIVFLSLIIAIYLLI